MVSPKCREKRAVPSSGQGILFLRSAPRWHYSRYLLQQVFQQVIQQVFAFLRRRQRSMVMGWSCCCGSAAGIPPLAQVAWAQRGERNHGFSASGLALSGSGTARR